MTAAGMSAAAATSDPPNPNGDGYSGAQRHPVPLDAPDIALRGQRLLAYGERLRHEEAEIIQEQGWARLAGRLHRPSMDRQAPEVRVRQPRAPLISDQLAEVREILHLRPPRTETGMCREPRRAPEIGRRPLDLGVPHHPQYLGPAQPAMPPPQHVDVPPYDEYYKVATGALCIARPGPPMQHQLAKLDVFKGEIGERLDDFVCQAEQFAAFHAWDPVETCRQARTHLWVVALAYIRRTPLPSLDWTELKDLLTRRFQPRDLTAAYKAQFRTRQRQRNEDIPTYVDALQKLAEMAWPLLDPLARVEMVADQFLNGLDSTATNSEFKSPPWESGG